VAVDLLEERLGDCRAAELFWELWTLPTCSDLPINIPISAPGPVSLHSSTTIKRANERPGERSDPDLRKRIVPERRVGRRSFERNRLFGGDEGARCAARRNSEFRFIFFFSIGSDLVAP